MLNAIHRGCGSIPQTTVIRGEGHTQFICSLESGKGAGLCFAPGKVVTRFALTLTTEKPADKARDRVAEKEYHELAFGYVDETRAMVMQVKVEERSRICSCQRVFNGGPTGLPDMQEVDI